MAIPYSGGTYRNDLYLGIVTRNALLSSINTTLVAAGFTSQVVNAYNLLTLTGIPADGDNVTIGSLVYTFKTVINNAVARQVLIGGSAAISASNLQNAVNAGPGAGVAYSSVTTANTLVTAVSTTTTAMIKIQAIAAGFLGNGSAPCSNGGGVFSWYYFNAGGNNVWFGGFVLTSAVTPQGLQAQFWFMYADEVGDPIRIIGRNVDNNVASGVPPTINTNPNDFSYGAELRLTAGANWRVIGSKYQFFAFAEGAAVATSSSYVAGGAPWIWDFLQATSIASVSNTTPIQVSTVTTHGLTTGQNARLARTGVPDANGTFAVTVTGPSTLTLDGSTAGGTSVGSGLIGEVGSQVAEMIWMSGASINGNGLGRANLSCRGSGYMWSDVNGLNFQVVDSAGLGVFSYIVPQTAYNNSSNNSLPFYGNPTLYSEPTLGFGTVAAGAPFIMCMTWDTVVATKGYSLGTPGTFDAHNWYVLTDNNAGDSANCQASLLVVVP